MAKVFVGNFSFSITEEQLQTRFSEVGEVQSVSIMKDPVAGRSRGFGFIEFGTEELAKKAIEMIDGQLWEGRSLKVSEDRSGSRRPGGFAPSGGSGYNAGGSTGGYSGGGQGGTSYDRRSQDGGQAPMGFFRAQPLDLGIKKKKKSDPFTEDETLSIDYKDGKLLSRFMSERGRILPRRMTGLTSHNQRLVTKAIKRARNVGILPYASR